MARRLHPPPHRKLTLPAVHWVLLCCADTLPCVSAFFVGPACHRIIEKFTTFHRIINACQACQLPAARIPAFTHRPHTATHGLPFTPPFPPASAAAPQVSPVHSKMSKTQEVAMRDLGAARQAYADGDVEASKAAHKAKVLNAPEQHKRIGGHVKSIVYGGLDGIITTFAVVAGAAGTSYVGCTGTITG